MIPIVTAILVSGNFAYAQSQPLPVQSAFLKEKEEIPYDLPERKPLAIFPEHNRYFIRMDDLNMNFNHPETTGQIRSPNLERNKYRQIVHSNYLTQNQSLRITRENNSTSWQLSEDKPKKRKAHVKNK